MYIAICGHPMSDLAVIVVDVGLAGAFTLIVCKAYKHASARGVWGHAPQEKIYIYQL